jgi:predicted Zn finger-like uncharacterized protein
MNITCPHCNARLNVPDHKIPKDKDSSFKCPKCQDKIQVFVSQLKASETGSLKKEGITKAITGSGGADQGRERALVVMADSAGRSKLVAAVQGLGFYVETTVSSEDALKKMAYQFYPLVLVEDCLEQNKGFAAMSSHMNELDMSLRRRICLILLGDQMPTGDPMVALHTSVNYIIGSDMDHLVPLLSTVLTEHRNFYAVYNESMRAAGKA